MSTSSRLLTGIFSTWANFLVSASTALVMAPFLVHQLGNAGYGLWSLYMAITGYFALLDFGVSPAIVRFTSRLEALGDREGQRRVLSTGLAFFGIASLVIVGLTLLGTVFYERIFPPQEIGLQAARMTFLFVGLDFALMLPFSIFQGLLLGRQRYLAVNGISLMTRLARFTLVLTLVGEGEPGLMTIAGLFLATGLVRDFGLVLLARRSLPGRLSLSEVQGVAARELLSYSVPAFIISIALRVIAYTDSMVIGYSIGVAAITYYALAASLVDYVQNIGWGLAGVLVPLVSGHEARGELEAIQARFLQFTRYCIWLMVPVIVGAMLLGESFFTRWVGPEYTLSAEIMYVLVVAMAIYVIQMPSQAILKGMSLHRRLAAFFTAEAISNLGLSLYLAPRWGALGVAYGTLIPRLVFTGVLLPIYTMGKLEVSAVTYFREALLPVFPGLVAIGGVWWAIEMWTTEPYGWLSMVLIGVSLVAVFGSITFWLGVRAEEKDWVRSRIKHVASRLVN